jgi:hypothetical protein
MGWLDWEGGFHHGDDDFDPDFPDAFERAERERREHDRAAKEAEDKAENQRRRYPPNCGFCGEPLATIDHEHHHDWEQGFTPHEYGHYSCGTDIYDQVYSVLRDDKGRRLTFEERVLTVTTNQWGFRVPFYRCEDYGIDPTSRGAQGQSAACRRLMELRWKTDPEALERDRTDTRTDREVMTVEAERKLVKREREEQRQSVIREALSRLDNTETWTTADHVTQPIKRLGHGHLVNIRLWLDRNAETYQRWARDLYWAERHHYTEDVHGNEVDVGIPEEVHNRIEDSLLGDPLEWMRKQPVYQAVQDAILASAPVDRRQTGFVSVVSPTPPPVPEVH